MTSIFEKIDIEAIIGIFALLFFLIGLLMSKNQKRYLLMALGLFIPLQGGLYSSRVGEHIVKLSYLPIVLLLILWLFNEKRYKILFPKTAFVAAGLISWSLLSVLFAKDKVLSLFEISRYVVVFALYLYIVNNCWKKRDIKLIIFSLLLGLSLQVAIGLYQNHYGRSIGLTALGEGSGELWKWRAIGTLRFPNVFGTYLVFILPLMLSLLFHPAKLEKRLCLGGLFALSFATLIFTYSRSSWIAFTLAGFLILILYTWRGLLTLKLAKKLFVVAIILSFFLLRYGSRIIYRFTYQDLDNPVYRHRLSMAEIAIDLVKAYPIGGVGLRNFHFYSKPDDPTGGGIVHNEFLRLGAETGIPGIILFLWLVFAIFKEGLKVTRSKDKFLARTTIGILSGFSASFITFIAGPEYRWFPILALFWVFAGLISAMNILEKKRYLIARKAHYLTVAKSYPGNYTKAKKEF